jgi:5-(carboxyamino)imidazole ribonucleotide synthase
MQEKKFIAMLGGGQLGLMFTESAHKMGEKVIILDPDKDCPAGKIADRFLNTDYLNTNSLNTIIENCDVCTTEFENIPYKTLEILEKKIKVYPNSNALKISQNRILEKNFMQNLKIPTTNFYEINSENDLSEMKNINDWPYIIKTSTFGYDGKGQAIVNNFSELNQAYKDLKSDSFILEKKVNLKMEVSQVACCYPDGIVLLPISENTHINNILHKSKVPAEISIKSEEEIHKITTKITKSLNYIGILCVEFFISKSGDIMVNEIAPRTHNSGHYSIEGCSESQFDHQVRILKNLEPNKSSLLKPSVMINLLGDLWSSKELEKNLIDSDGVFYHLYNKNIPKNGRKMGHYTVINDSLNIANKIADDIFLKLKNEK